MEMLEQSVEGGRREGETVLLMGDFNARVGRRRNEVERMLGPYGEEVRNTDGEILMDFCLRKGMKIMNGFFQQRDSHRFTRYRWNNNTKEFDQKSIIDYIISTDSKMVKNVKVIPGISMDSDHRLVVTDIRIRMERIQNKEKRSAFKVELLKENGKKREYIEKVKENLKQMEEVGDIMKIQETMRRVAEETLGRRWMEGTRKRHTKSWGEEVREAILRKTV